MPELERDRPFLNFALPDLDNMEYEEIKMVLDSGWLTTGARVKAFESGFAEFVGAKHAIAVNSCTAALHLALESVGVRRGDEVITTPYTFAATAEVIRYFDARPVFVDINPLTFNLDPALLESAITKRTKAIIPVHIAGLPADIGKILDMARSRQIPVIEDAAHAFPSAYKGRMIGSLGEITCFSFYATKTITTGEGGMICTNDDTYNERCRIMSLHGISKDAWKRYTAEGSWFYEIVSPGFKYNMSDIAAAIGIAQLKKANMMSARRAEIARAYSEAFRNLGQLQIPAENPECQHAWHLYMLRLNLDTLATDRAGFIEELKKRNIGASVHFIPLHLHPYYRNLYSYKPEDFPISHREFLREISLPIYSKMKDGDITHVINAVKEIVQEMSR